ncbi:MAG TPA: hypothetical protein ENJ84_05945 [Gammaproteobacteria bacterium]|nr:hypothetical protein [Gammaproteobacteria bacterium]
MLTKLLYKLSANRPCRLIHSHGRRYLERYYLGQFLGMTFYLHRFVDGDGDHALHDHPWHYCAGLCLAGSYEEDRIKWFNPETGFDCARKKVRPGSINLIRAATFHQILHTRPDTWTLFCHTRKFKQWGFLHKTKEPGDNHQTRIIPRYLSDNDNESHTNWWLTAPRGRDAQRAPLIGADRE